LGAKQRAETAYLTENKGLDTKLKLATPAITQRFNAWLRSSSQALLGEMPSQMEQEAAMSRIQADVYKSLGLLDLIPAENTAPTTAALRYNPQTGQIE
jgi:hypothetical protein